MGSAHLLVDHGQALQQQADALAVTKCCSNMQRRAAIGIRCGESTGSAHRLACFLFSRSLSISSSGTTDLPTRWRRTRAAAGCSACARPRRSGAAQSARIPGPASRPAGPWSCRTAPCPRAGAAAPPGRRQRQQPAAALPWRAQAT